MYECNENDAPLMNETVKIRELSDKKSEWYKERFGDTAKYRTYKQEYPKCKHKKNNVYKKWYIKYFINAR